MKIERAKSIWLIGAAAFLLFCFSLAVVQVSWAAEEGENRGQAYLLVIDKLNLQDIDSELTPQLHTLVQQGAIALVGTRTLRNRQSQDASLTIGAGNIARAYDWGLLAWPKNEGAQAAGWSSAAGIDLSVPLFDDYASVLANLNEIKAGLVSENVSTVAGMMGELLARQGYRVALLGNGDIEGLRQRNAIAIVMDTKGGVPLGNIGEDCNRPAEAEYGGLATNYSSLAAMLDEYEAQAELIAIDLSDLARLEQAGGVGISAQEAERKKRLSEMDGFIARLVQRMDLQRDILWIVVPSVSRTMNAQNQLFTPFLAYGSNIEPGLFSSASTRQDYIIAATDIAPGILQFFSISPAESTMIGRAPYIIAAEGRDTLKESLSLLKRTAQSSRLRSSLLQQYVLVLIGIILLTLLALLMHWRIMQSLCQWLIVAALTVPLIFLFSGVYSRCVQGSHDGLFMLLTIFMAMAASMVLWRCYYGRSYHAAILVCLLTTVALSLDLISGHHLIKSSILGYDPMAGARFYGLGNEFLGVFLGSSVALAAYCRERRKKGRGPITSELSDVRKLVMKEEFLLTIFFIVLTVLIGHPRLGANTGGFITAVIALALTGLLLSGLKLGIRNLFFIVGAALLALAGLVGYELSRPAELQSHIGQAMSRVLQDGNEAALIIQRKLAMNIKLIRYSIWGRIFLLSLLAWVILLYRPLGAMKQLQERHPLLLRGFIGTLITALLALVFNDSGVVTAAIASIYLVFPLLLLILNGEEAVAMNEPCEALPE